jgi:tetratricopeptide (TPR) repeat protein
MTDLLADRENRPYLDVLHHQLGLYYDKKKDYKKAIFQYNRSLSKRPTDAYLKASDYRNIAQAYFNSSKYVKAGMYFDSTLTALNAKSREYKAIKKKRDNLNDVIKYEAITLRNDSILAICAMTPFDRETYYQKHIDLLKKAEVLAAIKEKEIQKKQDAATPGGENVPSASNDIQQQLDRMAARSNSAASSFYFYTASTVSYGREQFKKIWGDRSHKGNWRTNSKDQKSDVKDAPETKPDDPLAAAATGVSKAPAATISNPEYEPSFYTAKLPKSKVVIDSLAKERNFAYYQLGMIYKEKFKEYERSSDRFERLLRQRPEERLVLPSLYHLYKVYEIIDKDKAEIVRQRIIKDYPNSRYAELLSKKGNAQQLADAPRESYDKLYKAYQQDALRETYPQVLESINLFTGEDLIPKFELLKARLSGRLFGLKEYAQNLNYVALNYPNTAEGREAEKLLGTQVMALDALAFSAAPSKNWKIVFPADPVDSPEKQELLKKLTTFAKERTIEKLNVSVDLYTMEKNLFVIHGFKTEANAQSVLHVLKDYKDYLIIDPMYIISADNYKVVQIKKCLEEFISSKPAPAYHFNYKAPENAPDKSSSAQPQQGNNEPPRDTNDANPGQPQQMGQPSRNPKNPDGQNMPSQTDGLNGDDPMPGNARGNQKEPAAFPAVKKP